ncbi:MAG: response regulator [Caldiserica bacterium]|nr:MAG: response regulator [Caldisericota bacterium]
MKRVLVIDDDPQIMIFIKFILEKNNFEVFSADSGMKGLEILQNEDIDIVLLDVMMPGMDGYEVCRKIRENPKTKDKPVLMLTALGMGEDFEKALEVGANWYIVKPFKPQQLIERINMLLEEKKGGENEGN